MALGARAQGGCSITLLSDTSTLYQSWCLETPVATIEPIVWLVEGTGVQVHYLPAGVTATFSNDTLTISGTISSEGLYHPQITTSEGCTSLSMAMHMSVIVDPEFSCSVEGGDVILHWPGINAPQQYGWDMYVACSTADGFVDVMVVILPDADSLVWSGLPTNTLLTFDLVGTGAPYCFPGFYTTTCTIITAAVQENEGDGPVLQAVVNSDLLQLSASADLSELSVYDMLGGLVATHRVNARTATIPIASLASGAFIVRATGADGRMAVQRFVKE